MTTPAGIAKNETIKNATEDAPEQMVIVDIGKQKRKRIRRLRKGRGRLTEKIRNVIENLREEDSTGSKQTVVVVVREKRRRGGLRGIL